MPIDKGKHGKNVTQPEIVEEFIDTDTDEDDGLAEEITVTAETPKKAPIPVYAYSGTDIVHIIKTARTLVDETGEFAMSDLQNILRSTNFGGAHDGANLRRVFNLARKQLIKEGLSEELAAKRVPQFSTVRKGLGVGSLAGLLED